MSAKAPDTIPETMHWALMGELYSLYESPLTPCGQDVAAFQRVITRWQSAYGRQRLRVLQCGVTPALASMAWPDDAELLAVDKTEAAIRALWPRPPGRRCALCANRLQLPQADASCDVAAGDGSFNCLQYPQEYLALAASLHRILRPGGLLLMRCFIRPDPPEKPEQVFTELRAGLCVSFHEFKWRLAMALQPDITRGVLVDDVLAVSTYNENDIDKDTHASRNSDRDILGIIRKKVRSGDREKSDLIIWLDIKMMVQKVESDL